MKHLFTATLLLLALLMPATATAHQFEVDGIYYNILNDNEAEVTYKGTYYNEYSEYSGDIIIPPSVSYNGTTYSVTTIGRSAFYGCSALTSINIPNSVTNIGSYAFYECRNLKTISIPNSVTSIGFGAFDSCSKLTSIDIPNSVTDIGSNAFFHCSALTSINIPNSVTDIGSNAFFHCSALTSINIPNSVTNIGDNAFGCCSGLTSITVASDNPKYDSRDNCNALIETASNTLIQGCMNTTIPNSVTTIGDNAFYDCTALTNISIPNSVTIIGDYAFYYCSALTNINIPNSVITIGNYAFFECSALTNINIPNSVTIIGDHAFYNCSALTNINIPNSVTIIGDYAFYYCSALTSIIVASDNPKYDSRDNCNAIIETASNTLSVGCMNTTIPNSVTAIGNSAFSYCNSLANITIPNSVTTIGDDAFFCCTSLTYINIPNSVTTIGSGAFAHCYSLASVTIPNSVTTIRQDAFYYCTSLTYINIPNSVTNIYHSAFRNCFALDEVYSFIDDLSNLTMDFDVFLNFDLDNYIDFDYSDRTLYVPAGTSAAYQADTKWSQYFGNIVEMDAVASSIEVDRTAAVVVEGETLQLNATVFPKNTANKTVAWSSSDPSVATVDENGLVTGVAVGQATITAATTDGSNLNASCHVSVKSLSADNAFYMYGDVVLHGDTITIPVYLNNSETILAFQTDIYLPEGFNVVTNDDDEYDVTPSDRLSDDHILIVDRMEDGAVRVLCYTPWSVPITGDDGALFYINVAVPQEAAGDYSIYLRNSLLTKQNYQELYLPDAGAVITVTTFIPGDVNDSHNVTVTDIVVTAQYVMQQHPSPFIFEAADMNGDGNITVTDIMLIASEINRVPQRAPRRSAMVENGNDRMSGESVCLANGETRIVSILLDNTMDYCAFQLDLNLPEGLTATNFALTDRAGSHILDVNTIDGGSIRALCYTPALTAIGGHEGALLTFDVTATGNVMGDITVDGIELVTTACETVRLDAFAIGVDNVTAVSETMAGKTVSRVDYFNAAGQQLSQPATGMNVVVTTYTDGTRTVTKVIR